MKIDDNGTVRDMNEEELATLETIKQSIKDREKAAANKAKAKELVLEKLGLTSEEVVALLS
jgi:hypothetical protein